MPREGIYLIAALFGAVVCLVLVVGVLDEVRRPPSLRRRLAVFVALALALFALWSMVWPVTTLGGMYCGFAPGLLTDTPIDQAHQACTEARWLRLIVGFVAGIAAVITLAVRKTLEKPRASDAALA